MQWSFFSILLNDTSKGYFPSSRGLQQGHSLSPLLFSLVADGLSAILLRAERAIILQGFIVGDGIQSLSHLQFTDDTILFLEANERNITNMEICLKIFDLTLGLKVNMLKSCMVGINLEELRIRELAEVVGCKVVVWPIKYLGAPLDIHGPSCFGIRWWRRYQKSLPVGKRTIFRWGGGGKNYFNQSGSL